MELAAIEDRWACRVALSILVGVKGAAAAPMLDEPSLSSMDSPPGAVSGRVLSCCAKAWFIMSMLRRAWSLR